MEWTDSIITLKNGIGNTTETLASWGLGTMVMLQGLAQASAITYSIYVSINMVAYERNGRLLLESARFASEAALRWIRFRVDQDGGIPDVWVCTCKLPSRPPYP